MMGKVAGCFVGRDPKMRTGNGIKGDRHYGWAMTDVGPDDARRRRGRSLVPARPPPPLPEFLRSASAFGPMVKRI